MSADWLSPIRSALDAQARPADIFFRDDDAGWNDERLNALLDCFSARNAPLDLAVIPQAAGAELAEPLLERWRQDPSILGLHQHGYAHSNHETDGRKCEFGLNRGHGNQYHDLKAGKEQLDALFGPALDPIFTPPWNRCTDITADCLIALSFRALSRDRTALPLNLSGLQEIPVHVDWCGIRARSANPWLELGHALAERLLEPSPHPLGIMLHHAVMDGEDLDHLEALLDLFSEHRHARRRLMRELLAP